MPKMRPRLRRKSILANGVMNSYVILKLAIRVMTVRGGWFELLRHKERPYGISNRLCCRFCRLHDRSNKGQKPTYISKYRVQISFEVGHQIGYAAVVCPKSLEEKACFSGSNLLK